MKKLLLAVIAIAALLLPNGASANQGFFGGRSSPDGAINMRQSTTEQFDPIRGQSVAQRPRPDFDPTPIDIASFQFFPAITAAGYYDSNIYSAQSSTKDDVVWKIDPTLAVVSNWGRHAIAFTGIGDINRYTNNSTEDFNGGAMQMEGRYDIAAQTWASGTASYQRATEPRSSPSGLGSAAEPTQFNLTTAGAELYRGVGMLKLKGNYDFSYYEYDAVKLTGGGLVSLSGRDRSDNGVRGEASYDYTENFKPFVRGGYDARDYVTSAARSSTGYNADVGAHLDFGGITTGEVYVGYAARDYYNFGVSPVDMFNFGGNLLWNVTELTSVEAEAGRTIDETTVGGSAAFVTTGGSVTVTHELQRNVILEGNLSFTNYDFDNSSRSDDIYGVGAGMRYFISRNLYGDVTYDFNMRDTNIGGADYDRHILLFRVGVQN